MKMLFNYLWRLWFVLLSTVITLLFIPFAYLASLNAKHFPICYFFIKSWCFILFYGMGFRYELILKTEKPVEVGKQYIFIANHTSLMDIMLMCVLHPKHPICFVGKKELSKIPIFGSIYKRICVMVDRESMKSRTEVYARCAEKMKSGQNIVFFPEGGVSENPTLILDKFKDGAFALASQQGFPLVVYTFIGLKEMFPFDYGSGYPGKIKVVRNDVISCKMSKEQMKEMAFNSIYETLLEKK